MSQKRGVADTQTCNDDHLFPSRNVEEEVQKQEPVTVYRRLRTRHQAPFYNTRGYRLLVRISTKAYPSGCMRSLFTLHNETFNIWSHWLPPSFARLAKKRFLSYLHRIGRRRLGLSS